MLACCLRDFGHALVLAGERGDLDQLMLKGLPSPGAEVTSVISVGSGLAQGLSLQK